MLFTGMGSQPLTTIEQDRVRLEALAQNGTRLSVQCVPPCRNIGG